jgi:hypothetical protein
MTWSPDVGSSVLISGAGFLIVIGQALRTPVGETNAWHVVARVLIG